MRTNVDIVSEAVRRANSRAIADRNRWRRQYAAISESIRRTKARHRIAGIFGSASNEQVELATLRALRVQADLMMLYRQDIAIELRDTAYAYAPREALA